MLAKSVFFNRAGQTALYQGIQSPQILANAWASLRSKMIRSIAADFNRDEWAYMLQFLAAKNLLAPWHSYFGEESPTALTSPTMFVKPVEEIAIWLPSNVSLLGPLTMVYLSLTGAKIRIKAGSAARSLCKSFLDFTLSNTDDKALQELLMNRIELEIFDRHSDKNREWAAQARLRILFGSDQAADAIEKLPHPANSHGLYFTDRKSEAWVSKESVQNDDSLLSLVKVFQIYGQAGCTSPKRVVLLDFNRTEAESFCQTFARLWQQNWIDNGPQHTASENFLFSQIALAKGFTPSLLHKNGALLILSEICETYPSSPFSLSIQYGTSKDALATMPQNIQTVGLIGFDPRNVDLHVGLVQKGAKRIVPVQDMHNFDYVWDGSNIWNYLFDYCKVG